MSHAHDPHSHQHAAAAGAPAFEPTDPHGETHHEHVIVSARTLMAVLLALLFFTVLTVGLSRGEVWAAETFNVNIPQWVNVLIAMSIATVKGLLVLLYFMQLKYDNKLNAIIFANCIFGVGLFLFFTMIDLGNRDAVYDWKKGEIQQGGLGGVSRGSGSRKEDVNTAIVTFAREKWLAEWGPEKFERIRASIKHEHHEDGPLSTPDASRMRMGLTGALSTTEPAHDSHSHHGGEGPADGHKAESDHTGAAPAGDTKTGDPGSPEHESGGH